MSFGEIICSVLKSIYEATKFVLEAAIPLAFQIVKKSITLTTKVLNAINEVWKDISNLMVVLLGQFQKMLWDIIQGFLGNPLEKLCVNMWKCDALLLALLDGNSFLTRMLFKGASRMIYGNYSAFECSRERYDEVVDYIREALSNFKSFMDTVCNFGLTTTFGIEELKRFLDDLSRKLRNFTDKLKMALSKVMSWIEELEKSLRLTGIFDCLKTLTSFVNCVLDDSSICSEYSTINNLIDSVCSTLNVTKNSTTGEYEFDKAFLRKWDDRLFRNTDTFATGLTTMIDGMMSEGGSVYNMLGGINYTKAYDMTNFLVGSYRYMTDDSTSIKRTIKNKWSSLKDSVINSIYGHKSVIITDNLMAMGIDDYDIGLGDIRYFLPYQYWYRNEGSDIVDYGYADITEILQTLEDGENKFPLHYNERENPIHVGCPKDEEVYNTLFDYCKNLKQQEFGEGYVYGKDWGILRDKERGLVLTQFYNWSEYCNLSSRIDFDDEKEHSDFVDGPGEQGERTITIKKCNGGVMLFLNTIVSTLPYRVINNITQDEVVEYAEDEHEISTSEITLDSNANIENLNEKVIVGDKITSVGTLAIAMKDYMDKKKSILVDTFGEDVIAECIEIGKKFYGFLNVNIEELSVRYL